MRTALFFVLLSLLSGTLFVPQAHAAALLNVRDLVSTSVASATSTHAITLTVTSGIPASGKLLITPHPGAFTIPAGFDYTDVDFAVSSGGPFVEQPLAATPSATDNGVSVVTGTSGSITITLNSSTGLSAGDQVRVRLGSNAVEGATGDEHLIHPSSIGSYRMTFQTLTAGDVRIDDAGTRIAIVPQVTTSLLINVEPPVRSNGLPSGSLSHGNPVIEISLNTDELATCRYATTTGVAYGSMTGTFSYTGNTTLHYTVLSGHTDGNSYDYFVRCSDVYAAANEDDYAISFALDDIPEILVSTGQVGSSGTGTAVGGGGSGAFSGGSPLLYRASVTISGFTSPLAQVTTLVDGTILSTAQARTDGSYEVIAGGLERGTYTIAVYATDSAGHKSSTYTSTLSVGQGTNNTISGIIIPPTVVLSADSVDPGAALAISGESVPDATIELFVTPQGASLLGDAQKYTVTVPNGSGGTQTGKWSVDIDTSTMSRGTYEVRARALYLGEAESAFSKAIFLGIGEEPSPDLAIRADINRDGKVNLTDFSILLSFWGTANDDTDINLDGTANLADFSILLFNWTG